MCVFLLPKNRVQSPSGGLAAAFDLTPFYGFEEDAIHWHRTARDLCLPLVKTFIPVTKSGATITSTSNIATNSAVLAGCSLMISNTPDFDHCFAFMQAVGKGYTDAYLPIVERRKAMAYGERERNFQLYRRGRYVEFNLVSDRGTLFGLQTGGRTESILMSMPPLVRWEYDYQPKDGSPRSGVE